MATLLVGGIGLYLAGNNYLQNNKNTLELKHKKDEIKNNNSNNIKKKNKIQKEIIKLKKDNYRLKNNTINNNNSSNFLENDNLFNNNNNINNKSYLDDLFKVNNLTEDFKHNNMVHFFGSKSTQNIHNSQQRTLDLFTGGDPLYKKKTEVENEFPKNKENINGMPNNLNFYEKRYENISRYVSNELPFEQIKVGPGLGIDNNISAAGNFHPDIREYELPKNIDELRTKNNPKMTYKGKIINGKKEILRDSDFNFTKYKKSSMFVNRPLEKGKSYIPSQINTGSRPEIVSKNNRKVSMEIKGPGNKIIKNVPNHIKIQENKKQQLKKDNIRNIGSIENKFDYNKDYYCCQETKREQQSVLGFKKDYHIRNFLEALIPTQHYSDKTRKTIKETTENNNKDILNLCGTKKNQLYNQQLAKKTIKETTETNTKNMLNLQGGKNGQLYNKQPARKTIKETTENNIKDILNIKVYTKLPKNIKIKIRKSLKETLLHTPRLGNILLSNKQNNNINDINNINKFKNELRTTLKELLIKDADLLNFVSINKPKNYFSDKPKITHKETYVDEDHIGIPQKKINDGYKIANIDLKETNKQDTTNNEYIGIASREDETGYMTNIFEAKQTNKEEYVDNDYYGTSKGDLKTISYDDIYNATINELKEETLKLREPTQTSVKNTLGADSINVDIKSNLLNTEPDSLVINRIQNSVSTLDNDNFNKVSTNKLVSIEDMKDFNASRDASEEIIEQLNNNPLNISVV